MHNYVIVRRALSAKFVLGTGKAEKIEIARGAWCRNVVDGATFICLVPRAMKEQLDY